MTKLLVIREQIVKFVTKNENYVRPISKFILALITLVIINSKIGFATRLANGAITIIISLLASFLPINFIIIIAMIMILLHLYSLSTACAVVIGVLFLLMFLLYFRFAPKTTVLLLFTPICFLLKVPYVMPLCAGLVCSPASIITIACGTVTYYAIDFISNNASVLIGNSNEEFVTKLKMLMDEIMKNKEMLMLVVAFSFTIVVVNIIRRLSVDHAWTIAIVTGTLLDILIVLIGDLKYGTYISVVGLIFGSFVAVLVVTVIKFFVFNVDYTRTERVQFEDDEYYYYVKAVPKNTVSIADKQIKKIKGQGTPAPRKEKVAERESAEEQEMDAVEYRVRRSTTKEAPVRHGKRDANGLTDIERAAAAKARAQRSAKK